MQRPPTTGRLSAALAYLIAAALIAAGAAVMLTDRFDQYIPVTGNRRTALAAWLAAHGVIAAIFVLSRRSLPLLNPSVAIYITSFALGAGIAHGAAIANLLLAGWAVLLWEAQTMWVATLAVLAVVVAALPRLVPMLDLPSRVNEEDVIGLYALVSRRYRLRAALSEFGSSMTFMVLLLLSVAFVIAAVAFQIALGHALFLSPEIPTIASIDRAFESAIGAWRVFIPAALIIFAVTVLSAAYEAYKAWRNDPEPLD